MNNENNDLPLDGPDTTPEQEREYLQQMHVQALEEQVRELRQKLYAVLDAHRVFEESAAFSDAESAALAHLEEVVRDARNYLDPEPPADD